MVRTPSQVTVLVAAGVAAVTASGALCGCDSPARVKPWRHAPDPSVIDEAAGETTGSGTPVAPSSPSLTSIDKDADPQAHARRAHTLRIHMDGEPGKLSPLVAPSVWARRITLGTVFEPLIRYAPPDDGQAAGSYAPRLARAWKIAPSGLEIRIELQPQVVFHDGRPLTSSDVMFTLDAVRDPRRRVEHLRPLLDDVEAIELISPHELRLRLKRPNGWVLRALAEIPILPMHVYDGSLLAGGALVGTGPWKLTAHKAGVIHLAKNDRYWGTAPAIADVEFVYEPDAAVALNAAKRGDFDIIPSLIPAHWPEQANAPGIVARFRPLELAPPRIRVLAFNTARVPLDDPHLRHALALIVDRRTIAKRVFDGLARPALWPIWPGGPLSASEPGVADLDPAAAAKLLDAAGWTDADPKDGIRDQAGKQLRLVMVGGDKPIAKDASNPQAKLAREYFVVAARRIGVVIDIKTGNDAWLDKRIADGNYDIAELAWSGMVDSDIAPLVAHGSPAVDRALAGLVAAWDPSERARLAPELATALDQAWPFAGVVADAPRGLIAIRVRGARVWDGWIDLSQLSLTD